MKILLEAPILTRSGYGEHSRLVYRSLKPYLNSNLELHISPLSWGSTSWITEDSEERREIDQLIKNHAISNKETTEYDLQIHVGIPNEFEKKAKRSISVTAGIETNKVSPNWIFKTHQGIDKIIVPSEHAKTGFTTPSYQAHDQSGRLLEVRCNCEVSVVPYPVKEIEPDFLNLDLKTNFNFLSVALLGPRKNIETSIKWFVEVFKNNEDVGLILKTGISKNSLIDRQKTKDYLARVLEPLGERKCKVYLLHGNLSDSQIHSLYKEQSVRAYITTTHGEGYGLPIFEAAYSGLPVIATDWSGHLDFLTTTDSKTGKKKKKFSKVDYLLKPVQDTAVWDNIIIKDSMWAFPKERSFKEKIKKVYNSIEVYDSLASSLKKAILTSHSTEKIYEKMALEILGEETIQALKPLEVELSEIPKISIITSVYNGDEFIEGFMKDIINQTIFKEKCELILINPASPGSEYEIIKKYVEKYPENIKYLELKEDPGIYEVWNKAIAISSGEFITNANLDDRKSKFFMEELSKFLYINKEVDVVYGENLLTFLPNENFENNSSNGQIYPAEEFSIEGMLRGNSPHCMPMWRKKIHEKNGYFESDYKSASDWEFWLRCTFAGSKFKKFPKPLGLYYFNPTGMSTDKNNDSWKKEEERTIFKKYQKLYLERR